MCWQLTAANIAHSLTNVYKCCSTSCLSLGGQIAIAEVGSRVFAELELNRSDDGTSLQLALEDAVAIGKLALLVAEREVATLLGVEVVNARNDILCFSSVGSDVLHR